MIVLLAIFALVILLQVFLSLIFLFNPPKNTVASNNEFSLISIVIAFRNEEENLLTCLESIKNQSYSNFEVLLGNDNSDDASFSIANDFISKDERFQCYDFKGLKGQGNGKTKVLAALESKTKGEFILTTDADTKANPEWLRSFISNPNLDIQTGITLPKSTSTFGSLQRIEWLYAFSLFYTIEKLGKPVTSIGNNMWMKVQALKKTGGFAKLPFHLTEDYLMFKTILKNGGKHQQLFNSDAVIETKPEPTFKKLINQRHRWMFGAFSLPIQIKYPALLLAFSWLLLPLAMLISGNGLIFISYLLVNSFLKAQIIFTASKRLKIKLPLLPVIFFEWYLIALYIPVLFRYLFFNKIEWKGRIYKTGFRL